MKKINFVILIFSIVLNIRPIFAQDKTDIVIGQTVKLNSKVLNEDRNIQVYLPAGYGLTTDKYPVLVILDGEAHFNYTAGVVQFLAQYSIIPQMIVVGIPNTNRNRDFTPTKVENIPGSGGADSFLKFLGDELLPYVDKNYRTQPYRILAGHSLCGMYAFYTMFNRPEYFNSYIGLSPWVIYDSGYLLGFAKSKLSGLESLNKTFYFSAGSLETDLLPTMNDFVYLLKKNAPKDFDWSYKEMEGDDHGSLVLETIHDGLRYIYKSWAMPAEVAAKGLDGIMEHYKNLSSKYGYDVVVPEFVLNAAGYNFLFRGNMEQAITIFKKNVEMNPKSANVYDSLGEAFERNNQMQLARENYEKAYNLAKEQNHAFLETFKANYERSVKALSN